jgi:hypothetical protein
MKMNIVNRIAECEREYETINNFKGLLTFQWLLSYKNPSWSKKEITRWVKEMEETRVAFWGNPTPIRKEEQRNPTPIRSTQLATVARCLGNQIIGVGARVRSILLRYAMTVMMRQVRMER